MSQLDFSWCPNLTPKTEIECPDNASEFDHCLPPIVIPLERVKLKTEENPFKDHFFDGSNSTNKTAIPASNIDSKQLTSDLELMIKSRRCPICKAPPFKETFFVAVHILRHFEVKLYRCADCDKRFWFGSQLSAHQQKEHNAVKSYRRILDPGSRTCTVCDKMFRERRTFASHMLVRHSKSLSKQQIDQLRCEKDVRKKQTPKHIQCPFCQIYFLTIPQLAKHLVRSHRHQVVKTKPVPIMSENITSIRPFACDFDACHKAFLNKEGLKQHQRLKHGIVMPKKQPVPKMPAKFVCDFDGCHRAFFKKDGLKQHQTLIHGVTCDFAGCDKIFPNKRALMRHQHSMRHTNSYSKTVQGVPDLNSQKVHGHVCPLCDTKHPFSCNKVPEMCRHLINEHSNLIPTSSTRTMSVKNGIDQCPYCDCDDFTDFTLHILQHFKVRLFQCIFCTQQFYQYLQLIHHQTTSDTVLQKSTQIAKTQAVQFIEYASRQISFCPTKNECLNKLRRRKMFSRIEDKTVKNKCGQYVSCESKLFFIHSHKNQSQSSHTIKLVTLHFSMYSESIPTANLIDRMSCPMCHKLFPFDQLLQHLGGTDLKISFDASGLLTTNEMSEPASSNVSHGGSHLNLPATWYVPSLAPEHQPVQLIPFKPAPNTKFVLVQPNKSHEATQLAPQVSNSRPSIPNSSSSSTPGPSYPFDAETQPSDDSRVCNPQMLIQNEHSYCAVTQ